jgi:hypothetical protein
MIDEKDFISRKNNIKNFNGNNFVILAKLANLDPEIHFQYSDWSGVDFSGCDLSGFNFTGSDLSGCNFNGSILGDAIFSKTIIDGSNLEEIMRQQPSLSNSELIKSKKIEYHFHETQMREDIKDLNHQIVTPLVATKPLYELSSNNNLSELSTVHGDLINTLKIATTKKWQRIAYISNTSMLIVNLLCFVALASMGGFPLTKFSQRDGGITTMNDKSKNDKAPSDLAKLPITLPDHGGACPNIAWIQGSLDFDAPGARLLIMRSDQSGVEIADANLKPFHVCVPPLTKIVVELLAPQMNETNTAFSTCFKDTEPCSMSNSRPFTPGVRQQIEIKPGEYADIHYRKL